MPWIRKTQACSPGHTEALSAFLKIQARHPLDGPTALYVERCQEFQDDPPPRDWDGVYRMKTK